MPVSILKLKTSKKELTKLKKTLVKSASASPQDRTELEDGAMSQSAARKDIEELLRQLREGQRPHDDSLETATDEILNRLSHKDFPALHCA